jgi:asparagine synthase (glutamine-hydrolysing)
MCGVTGIVSLQGGADLLAATERMMRVIVHRGPDDSGRLVEGSVALGFQRLSILDLEETGHQPMSSHDASCTIVFNGEIFNYLELRNELEERGYRFRSTGDTEVLLSAYCEWGADCLPRLNGMWAFLILDRRRNLLFGSRDRFGVKPLFMHRNERHVLFGSEIKAIRASGLYADRTDWSTIADFLVRRKLDESERTFFAGIEQVPAGSAFELGLTGRFRSWRFWSLRSLPSRTVTDPIEEYRDLFEDGVRLRMRSDVPLAVFLSGGVDSTSILCALARGRERLPPDRRDRLRALAFMDKRYDESQYIGDTIRQTGAELEPIEYGSKEISTDLSKILWHHDQPVHSTTALIGYRLSQAAAERGIKVILNGQGADETAAGYPSYFEAYWHTVLAALGPRALLRELQEHARLWGGNAARRFLRVLRFTISGQPYRLHAYRRMRKRRELRRARLHPWFTSDFLAHVTPGEARGNVRPDLNEALLQAVERSPLPLYLRIEDRNSMAHSVEVRVPFLDYRLVSLLFSLPGEMKMKGAYNKHVLREAMRGLIPDSVRERHEKMGFPSPAGAWMTELQAHVRDELASSFARELDIFNVAAILRDFDRHLDGTIDIGNQIFDVLQFLIWARSTSAATSAQIRA